MRKGYYTAKPTGLLAETMAKAASLNPEPEAPEAATTQIQVSECPESRRIADELHKAHRVGFITGADTAGARRLAKIIHLFNATVIK